MSDTEQVKPESNSLRDAVLSIDIERVTRRVALLLIKTVVIDGAIIYIAMITGMARAYSGAFLYWPQVVGILFALFMAALINNLIWQVGIDRE